MPLSSRHADAFIAAVCRRVFAAAAAILRQFVD
jgi:hypothetical protein